MIDITIETTLRGNIQHIGGLKEKLLAEHRAGIFEAIMPKDNEKDYPELPDTLRNNMKLHFVENMDDVLRIALERPLPEVADIVAEAIPAVPPIADQPVTHQ